MFRKINWRSDTRLTYSKSHSDAVHMEIITRKEWEQAGNLVISVESILIKTCD